MSDIDCWCTDEPTCPHCGASWQDDDHVIDQSHGRFVTECDECGGVYEVGADYTVTYSSSPFQKCRFKTQDGTEGEGYCEPSSIEFTSPKHFPPDGRVRTVYDRRGEEIALVHESAVFLCHEEKEAPHD